jgi:hypothetical protein
MKSISKHLIYIPIIAFLGFQYWSNNSLLERTSASLGGINQQFEFDGEIIRSSNEILKAEIDKMTQVNPKRYEKYQSNADGLIWHTKEASKLLIELKKQFVDYCGGWDTVTHCLKQATNSSKSVDFFTDDRKNQIKNQLSTILNRLYIVDEYDKELVFKHYSVSKILYNQKYWSDLSSLTPMSALTELSMLQNLIKCDETVYLNYVLDKVSHVDVRFDDYKVAIAPRKAVLIEGESFESDIYLTQYARTLPEGSTISVNGATIPIVDGIAHYKSQPNTTGKKETIATITIKNSATGEAKSYIGGFEYNVLPKCSRDCQQ